MDVLIKGTGDDLNFMAVDSTQVVRQAQKLHNLSITASVALGRLLTAGLLLGSQMKNKRNKLTLRVNGDGPLGSATVCGNSRRQGERDYLQPKPRGR